MEHRGSQGGFTIMEVVVASTLLLTALLGAAALFGNAMTVSGNTRQRVVGQHLATQQLEKVRGTAADPTQFVSIQEGQHVSTHTVNGIEFTVTEDIQWVGQDSTTSACDSPGATTGQILQVTETVTWKGMAGTQPARATTTLAPPVGAFSASTGSIAVKVLDAGGEPVSGVNVRITGPVTDTQKSTTQGCAYFAFLAPGTYTASIIEGTGVGGQNELTPAQTGSVVVGQTLALEFTYDTAATINFTNYVNSTAIPASGMSLSVANTGLQPYGHYSFAAGITTLTPLFPYPEGYTVFAGKCTDNNPLLLDSNGENVYPTAAGSVSATNVSPGGSENATALLYTLPVFVRRSGTPQAGATVTATSTTTFSPPYNVACTTGTATSAAPVLGLQNTDASGTSTTAVPLGHFTITARFGTRVGSVNVWVKDDGIWAVNASGAPTTLYTGPVTVNIS